MNIKSLFLIIFCSMPLLAHAQLSDMKVTGIEAMGKVENGPVHKYNKRPWALILLEVSGTNETEVNGNQILPLQQNKIVLPYSDDKVYDAYAAAWDKQVATAITLHHPDFNNCKIEFKDYLEKDTRLEEGHVYKIKLKIPSMHLVEANAAYNKLDFKKASELYSNIVADPNANAEEKIIASNQMTNIDSLISYIDLAQKYERLAKSMTGKERDRNLYRSRIYYDNIYSMSGLVDAVCKVEEINELLGVNDSESKYRSNTFKKIHAEMVSNDLRAFGNDAVTYTVTKGKKSEKRSCSLFILKVPVKDVAVEVNPEIIVGNTINKNDEIWFYTKTEFEKKDKKDENTWLFRLKHPDYDSFTFTFMDFDDFDASNKKLALQPEKVYRIQFDSPSLIMAMARKTLFQQLDLKRAASLFQYNFADGEEQEYAEKCREFLNTPTIKTIMNELDAKTKKCRSTEKEYFAIITGLKKFNDIQSRNKRLNEINRQLEDEASVLASNYRIIFTVANRYDIDLQYANNLANEFTSIKDGARRLPLIVEFMEMKQNKDEVTKSYSPAEKMSTNPTITVEITDDNDDTAYSVNQKIRNGKMSFIINTKGTELFRRGLGKIKFSTSKNFNNGKEPYKDMELDIRDFKISDYTTKKLNVTLIKK